MPPPAPDPSRPPRLGLLVNPVAGLGGRVGLKGSDGGAIQRRAVVLGARPLAGVRTVRALWRLADRAPDVEVVAAPGAMGADQARAVGLRTTELPGATGAATTADDTRAAAAELRRQGVDLLLVAGGDGTICDVYDAIGAALPVLGLPTGVKMHSGVFAATPEAAGEAAAAYLLDPGETGLREAEVADIDEAAVREGRIATHLYGVVRVPRDTGRVLAAKGGPPRVSDHDLDGAAARIIAELEPDTLLLVGPGTTTARIMRALELPATLLGIDAVLDGELVGRDLDERTILRLLDESPRALLALGVVGGQGALLGRGNQQLSAAVVGRIGRDRLRIVAAREKLITLDPPVLRVDTGDPAVDEVVCGYLPVRVSRRETVVMRLCP